MLKLIWHVYTRRYNIHKSFFLLMELSCKHYTKRAFNCVVFFIHKRGILFLSLPFVMTMIKEQCFSHSLNCLRDILAYQWGFIISKSGLDLGLKVSIKQVYYNTLTQGVPFDVLFKYRKHW